MIAHIDEIDSSTSRKSSGFIHHLADDMTEAERPSTSSRAPLCLLVLVLIP